MKEQEIVPTPLDTMFQALPLSAQIYIQLSQNMNRKDIDPKVKIDISTKMFGLLQTMGHQEIGLMSAYILKRDYERARQAPKRPYQPTR